MRGIGKVGRERSRGILVQDFPQDLRVRKLRSPTWRSTIYSRCFTTRFFHFVIRPPYRTAFPPHAEDSHSAEWLFIQTLPSSAILHGFINARNGKSKIQTLSPFFSLLHPLPLSASIDFNFSRVHAVATPRESPASILVKFARTRLSIYSYDGFANNTRLVPASNAFRLDFAKVKSREFYFAAVLRIRVKLSK